MRQRSFLWAIILALSAIVAGARAQRFYLPEDLSFTGSQYVWESRALFELSDPDMWLYCEAGYAPALQYLPPFSELRHLLHHPCRSYARWGYQGMIGYRVLTDYGYYFLSPLCDPIFLGYRILDDWLGRPLRILYRTYADLSYLHFRVRAFDNIWRHHRFYDYYPRYGHRHYGWYDNHHCYARPPRPNYAPPRPPVAPSRPHNVVPGRTYDGGRSGYNNRSSLRAGNERSNAVKSLSSTRSGSTNQRVVRSSAPAIPMRSSSSYSTRSTVPSSSYRAPSYSTRSSSSSTYRSSASSSYRSSSGSSFRSGSSGSYRKSSGASLGPSRSSGYSNRSGGAGRGR